MVAGTMWRQRSRGAAEEERRWSSGGMVVPMGVEEFDFDGDWRWWWFDLELI